MDDPNAEAEKLAIRCPGCGQRFNVGVELRERMVECGTCEHRFRVNDEVIVRARKFYPGERRDRTLDRFSRVPKTIATAQTTFQPVQYSDEPVHRAVETTSPIRVVFGLIAVSLVVIIALMLVFGGSAGGVLYGTSQAKRLMLAGFTVLVMGAFLIAANPRKRGKAILGAVAAAAGLLSLPFVFTEGNKPVSSFSDGFDGPEPVVPGPSGAPDPGGPEAELALLKEEIDLAPLEREIKRYQQEPGDPGRGVMGIWLRGLQELHKFQVRDYVIRNTGADPRSHMYHREKGYLMVVTGVAGDFEKLATLCRRFGEVRIVESLRVIDVEVRNEAFLEGPHDKLTDPQNPAFYELNQRELESIDLERAKRAVVRLASAEPKLYREDIIRRLLELIREGDAALQGEAANALLKWGKPGDGAEEVIRPAVEKIAATGKDVPEPMVKLLVLRKDVGVIPVINDLWSRDASAWEDLYGGLGPAIEDSILARFDKSTVTLKMSSIRLLGRVGTAKSLPVLEGSREGSVPEVQVLIDRAVASIRSRG